MSVINFCLVIVSVKKGFKPTINLPLQLANQIYSCWLESITDQIEELEVHYEKMVQEDAAFAMELQQKEFDKHRTPDLREIMDMEMALSLYKEDQVCVCVRYPAPALQCQIFSMCFCVVSLSQGLKSFQNKTVLFLIAMDVEKVCYARLTAEMSQ